MNIRFNEYTKPVIATIVILTALAIGLSVRQPRHPQPVQPALAAVQRANGNDYPAYLADAPTNSFADQWGMGNRECTSYVAWKVYETDHDMPNWTGKSADARLWPQLATAAGFNVGTTPEIGTVAVFQPGWTAQASINGKAMTFTENAATGHVAWVEAVNTDGTILVSEYDGATGNFARTTYPAAGLQYIDFNQRAN